MQNPDKLKDKKKTIIFLKYHFYLLAWKKRKLKLGKIVFEIKEYKLDELAPAYKEEIDIKYVRQDTLDEDELKIENRLKALKWKWDFSHVAAFLIIFFIFINLIYIYSYWWYCDHFPALAFKPKKFDQLVKSSFFFLIGNSFTINLSFINLKETNIWLAELISDLAVLNNFFF